LLLKVDPQDSAEFLRYSLPGYLDVAARFDHVRRGRGEEQAFVGNHSITTHLGRGMLQVKHDGVVGHARLDRDSA
jgi:hypothetical protein